MLLRLILRWHLTSWHLSSCVYIHMCTDYVRFEVSRFVQSNPREDSSGNWIKFMFFIHHSENMLDSSVTCRRRFSFFINRRYLALVSQFGSSIMSSNLKSVACCLFERLWRVIHFYEVADVAPSNVSKRMGDFLRISLRICCGSLQSELFDLSVSRCVERKRNPDSNGENKADACILGRKYTSRGCESRLASVDK